MNTEVHLDRLDQTASFDPAAHGWELIQDDGFIGLVGPMWQRLDASTMRYAFLAEPKHHNRRDVVHGGMIMTFADRALGMTVRGVTGHKHQATIQLDVHFVDAVQIGEFVETQAQIVRQTRSLVFVKADLFVGSRVIASVNGIWKILGEQHGTDLASLHPDK
jgi:uncharacterized protein (TIGR00369 family)